MLPGDGITPGIGKDKTCYPGSAEYKFKYGSEGLNTSDIKEEMDGRYYNLWSTDNDKIVPNDEVVIKSVYDPSPVGYSLPASNAFTGFTTTGGNIGAAHTPLTPEQLAQLNVKGDFDKGYYFYRQPNKQGNIFWFPAWGCRSCKTGSLYRVPTGGCYWVAGPSNRNFGRFLNFDSSVVWLLDDTNRGYGMSVRSAEEKVFKCGLKKLQIVCSFGENYNITTLKIRILLYTKTYFISFLSSFY